MNKILLIALATTMFICTGCGCSETKRLEEEAKKAELEYRQTVIDNLESSVATLNEKIKEYNTNRASGLPEYVEFDLSMLSSLTNVSYEAFNERSSRIKSLVELEMSNVIEAKAQSDAIKKMRGEK